MNVIQEYMGLNNDFPIRNQRTEQTRDYNEISTLDGPMIIKGNNEKYKRICSPSKTGRHNSRIPLPDGIQIKGR